MLFFFLLNLYDIINMVICMEKVVLTNMCMIYDKEKDLILIQERTKSWKGCAFPGGHVEPNESIVDSVIREIKEETGLEISNPKLIGVRDWIENNERTVSLLFMTTSFKGDIIASTEEGRIFWVERNKIETLDFAYGFKQQLPLFLEQKWSEIFSIEEEGKWKYIFY